jgi:hypothetical protein
MLAKAINDGFSGRKLGKTELYQRYSNRIKPGEELGARIEVIPPLVCANEAGQLAHDKLQSKPDLNYVRAGCLRKVTVNLVHVSPILNANWPCVFQKGDTTLQPSFKILDQSPDVVTYYAGFGGSDQVGYSYFDTYAFQFPLTFIGGASLVYADEKGQHHTLTYDFSVFAKDIAGR